MEDGINPVDVALSAIISLQERVAKLEAKLEQLIIKES